MPRNSPPFPQFLQARVPLVFAAVFLALLTLFSPLAFASDASDILAKFGSTKGIAFVAECGDGSLPIALTSGNSLVIVAQDASDANVATTRNAAKSAALLGSRMFVQKGAVTKIPFADNYVDLMVLIRLGSGFSSLPAAEFWRALCPNGKAFFSASASSVQAWLDAAGIPATASANGVWTTVTKSVPSTAGKWTHWNNKPDGNTYSASETLLDWPYLTQWQGKPYRGAQPNWSLANNGLLFNFAGWNFDYDEYPRPLYGSLRVFNAYNGTLLWTRPLHKSFHVHRSAAAAMDNALYLIDGKDVLVLDPLTGTLIRRIIFSDPATGHAKWLAVEGNTLFVLFGPEDTPIVPGNKYDGAASYLEPTTVTINGDNPDTTTITETSYEKSIKVIPATLNISDTSLADYLYSQDTYEAHEVPWIKGTKIVAYDTVNNTVRWVRTETGEIDARNIGILNGKMFFYAPNATTGYARCLSDLESSEPTVAWTYGPDADFEAFIGNYGHILRRTNNGILCTPEAIVFFRKGRTNYVALDPNTGAKLWTKGNGNANNTMEGFYKDGHIYLNGIAGIGGGVPKFNSTTGVQVGSATVEFTGCARLTASFDAIYSAGGRGHDWASSKPAAPTGFKSNCYEGTVPANGLLTSAPWTCNCNVSARGFNVMAPANGFNFYQTASNGERLETASNSTPATFPNGGANDWPTYRANNNRSSSSSASVPTTGIQTLWSYTPETLSSEASTAPIAVGNSIFYGTPEGMVRSVDSRSGALQWEVFVNGRIYSSPSYANDRLYVGSGDGFLYCLEALTGRQLWRCRLAPAERRIKVYGDLVNTWPVITGGIVQDGKIYAAAGNTDWDNPHVFCLDAATGAILWQNNTSGHIDAAQYPTQAQANKGMGAQGVLTIGGGKLWMPSGNQGSPACYDLATGVFSSPSFDQGLGPGLRGKEMGFFDGKFVVFGGYMLFRDVNERNHVRGGDIFFQEIDPVSGVKSGNEVAPFVEGGIFPAWDGTDSLVSSENNFSLQLWNTPATSLAISTRKASAKTKDDNSLYAVYNPLTAVAGVKKWGTWLTSKDIWSVALAPNAAIVVYGDGDPSSGAGLVPSQIWKISALARTDGTTLWTHTLPAEPLMESLCINRDGNIVLTLRNGGLVCVGGAVSSPETPSIVTPPSDALLTSGQSTTLSVIATGTGLTYQWYASGSNGELSPISGATNSTYTTPSLSASTRYLVVVRSASGGTSSASAWVRVGSASQKPTITTQPASLSTDSPALLSLTATDATSYQWYIGQSGDTSQPVSGANSASFGASPSSTTPYWCRVSNSLGHADSNVAVVQVDGWSAYHDLAIITDGNHANTTCGYSPQPISLINFATGTPTLASITTARTVAAAISYINDKDSNPAEATAAYSLFNGKLQFGSKRERTQTFKVTSAIDISSTTITLSGLKPNRRYTVAFYGNNGGTSTNRTAKMILGNVATGFSAAETALTADVTNSSDSDDATFKYDVDSNTTGSIVKWTNIRPTGDSGTSFKVDFQLGGSSFYYLPQGIFLQEQPGSQVTDEPDNATVSAGGTTTLSVTALNAASYQWYSGTSGNTSNPISGATSASYTIPPLASGSASYWVRVTDAQGGYADSVASTVTVGSVVDSFASFVSDYGFTGNDALSTADPDGDGINNLLEYALNLDPGACSNATTNGTSDGTPLIALSPENKLRITFIKDTAKTDITYEVQSTDSLGGTWTTLATGITETPLTGTRIRTQAEVDLPAGSKRFLRLKVSRP